MSGRIRTVKPEWLEDELIATASLGARVMSIGLILMADDYGNGRASPGLLGARIFPGGPYGIAAEAIAELQAIKFVTLYEVEGQKYYSIRNWTKHQRVDKPGKPHVPPPPVAIAPAKRSRGETAYFIRGEVTGLIKIGKSIDPVARLAELAKCSPEKLHLLAVGGRERDLHKRLAAHRVHGEWFSPHENVINAIREYGGDPESPITSAFYENDRRRIVHANIPVDVANIPETGEKVPSDLAPDLRPTTSTNDRERETREDAPPPPSADPVRPPNADRHLRRFAESLRSFSPAEDAVIRIVSETRVAAGGRPFKPSGDRDRQSVFKLAAWAESESELRAALAGFWRDHKSGVRAKLDWFADEDPGQWATVDGKSLEALSNIDAIEAEVAAAREAYQTLLGQDGDRQRKERLDRARQALARARSAA